MPAKIKKKYKSQIIIDSEMPDFSNDSVFVKRAEEAAAFFAKHPFPEELLKKIKEKNKPIMPAIKKNKRKAQTRSLFDKPVRGRIDKNMPDFDNDPVVVAKCERAAAFFDKNPQVIEFIRKIQEKNRK